MVMDIPNGGEPWWGDAQDTKRSSCNLSVRSTGEVSNQISNSGKVDKESRVVAGSRQGMRWLRVVTLRDEMK